MTGQPAATIEEQQNKENASLKRFVALLGFDADKVATAFAWDADNQTCSGIAAAALVVGRDFSMTSLSPAGIDAANTFLDALRKQ